jgi:uncharacterized damage-inducible protein DinB
MPEKVKWVDRKFDFTFPVEDYQKFIERLGKSPAELSNLVASIPREILVRRAGESWSIQENAGHLVTVEYLFIKRLGDYLSGAPVLTAADVTGNGTDQANYNDQDISNILAEFAKLRQRYLGSLAVLAPENFAKSSFHPRLKTTMRLCDMLFFQVEHDHYHLERIKNLRNR